MKKDYKDLKVGREFELYDAKRSFLQEWTRTIIALAIVATCLAALAFAAFSGSQTDGDNALLKVWAVVSVPLAAITGYYFRGSKPSGESDN